MQIRSIARRGAALVLLASLASATTYVVDPSGAGNFTDIQTAILASQPGDVLLVQPGTYAPFALDRGITIIGYGAINVPGGITIAGVPAGQTGVVTGLNAGALVVQGCSGPVILQDLHQMPAIAITASPDVRFARIVMQVGASLAPGTGLTLQSSRLEVVSSNLFGQSALQCSAPNLDGADGAHCGASRIHLARSTLWGGGGVYCSQLGFHCGDGGDGLLLLAGADAIVCGRSSDSVNAGQGGMNSTGGGCAYWGIPGIGITLQTGAQLRWSGVTLHGWDYGFGLHCISLHSPEIVNQGGTVVHPAAADPTLTVSGNPAPGTAVQFTLDGPPGATAVISFGRTPVVQPDPNTVIEVLVPPLRNVNLGTIGASGQANFTWPISGVLRPGSRLIAQGSVTLTSGEVRRTNSVPVIVR